MNISRRKFISLSAISAGGMAFFGKTVSGDTLTPNTKSSSDEQGLKDLAPPGFNIGCAMMRLYEGMPDLNQYRGVIKKEYNQITPGAMSWIEIQPMQNQPINWYYIDETLSWAAINNIQVIGNTPVYRGQLPDWTSSLSKTDFIDVTLKHIDIMVQKYAKTQTKDGRKLIIGWNLVNEVISPSYHSNWDFLTDQLPLSIFDTREEIQNYIRDIFLIARSADPDAKLFYNDNQVEEWGYWHTNAAFELITWLVNNGTPIDGLASQTHIFDLTQPPGYELVGQAYRNFYDQLGIPVRVSEMDVIFKRCEGTLEDQASIYAGVLSQALANLDAVTDFSVWDIADVNGWVPWCDNLPDWYVPGNPCTCPGMPGPAIMDEDYNKKPAYYALRDTLISTRTAAAPKVLSFVDTMYQSFLGVTPDSQEAMQWVEALQSGSETAATLVQRLSAHSQSVTQNMTDSEYISHMFRTTLGGTPNEDGMEVYRELLSTRTSREGFTKLLTESKAFADTYQGYWMSPN